ncbi:MAG: MerR family transcriptional regulator [Lachnospiraceae bacterium]|nr:MerR family transcriptional regulator [Lachnospiraceae bacterium]
MDKDEELKIGSLSQLTGVKASTIRFYEKCGFLEPAKRLPNGYRVFCKRHIYQIRVCRLVFGGFVNKRLRKISRDVLRTSRDWNPEAYRKATDRYLQAVEEDIRRTKLAVDIVMDKLQETIDAGLVYTKKQAAGLVGVTSETIRNWERNGLFRQRTKYEKRLYSQPELNRMYVIRLLLDNGYSMMAVRSFFREYDGGDRELAMIQLMEPGESEDLIYRADRYMETLLKAQEKARQLCAMSDEMKAE